MSKVRINNGDKGMLGLWLEPWGEDYWIRPDEAFTVVTRSDLEAASDDEPPFDVVVRNCSQKAPRRVRDLRVAAGVEASSLSHQLTVLRHAGVITVQRAGGAVVYSLSAQEITGLLHTSRQMVTALVTGRLNLADELAREAGDHPDSSQALRPARTR